MSLNIFHRIGAVTLGIFLITFGSFIPTGAMENKLIKVSLERSGGFTGIPLTTVVEVVNLPPPEAEQLCQLVEAADFFNYPALITAGNSLPDRFQYQIVVENDHQKHSVTVGEAVVPNKLRPLIDFVMKVGRRQ